MLLFRVCRQSLKVANWCQHFFEQNFDHHCLTDEQTLKRALLPHFPTPQAPMVLNSGPFRTTAYGRPHALSNVRNATNDARPNYRCLLVAVGSASGRAGAIGVLEVFRLGLRGSAKRCSRTGVS